MPTLLRLSVGLLALAAVAAGCGVKAQTYVMTKQRVDQDVTGNAGYLAGTPKPQTPTKATRKIYVLELSKEQQQNNVTQITEPAASPAVASQAEDQTGAAEVANADAPEPQKIVLPPLPSDEGLTQQVAHETQAASSAKGKIVEYKVVKDDTLQKIAKKFYNSYAKWPRIYDANRDRIKNPNYVKPGTILKIPTD